MYLEIGRADERLFDLTTEICIQAFFAAIFCFLAMKFLKNSAFNLKTRSLLYLLSDSTRENGAKTRMGDCLDGPIMDGVHFPRYLQGPMSFGL